MCEHHFVRDICHNFFSRFFSWSIGCPKKFKITVKLSIFLDEIVTLSITKISYNLLNIVFFKEDLLIQFRFFHSLPGRKLIHEIKVITFSNLPLFLFIFVFLYLCFCFSLFLFIFVFLILCFSLSLFFFTFVSLSL